MRRINPICYQKIPLLLKIQAKLLIEIVYTGTKKTKNKKIHRSKILKCIVQQNPTGQANDIVVILYCE